MTSISENLALSLRKCSTPLYQSTKYLYRVFSPILPGQFHQKSTALNEIIARVAITAAAAIMLMPSLILHAAGMFGRAVHLLATKQSYIGSTQVYSKEGLFRDLSIGTYNMNLFQGPLPTILGGVDTDNKRLERLADQLIAADLDTVCINEGHDIKLVHQLAKILEKRGLHYNCIYGVGDHPIKFNSGLAILSKYPIEDIQFIPFTQQNRQKMINKGFTSCRINGIRVIATHLDPHNEQVRQSELEMIDSHRKKMREPSVLIGDMNIIKHSDEYQQSLLARAYRSTYNVNKPTCNDEVLIRIRKGHKDSIQQSDIIDYIVIPNEIHPILFSTHLAAEVNNDPSTAASDHAFIFSRIRF